MKVRKGDVVIDGVVVDGVVGVAIDGDVLGGVCFLKKNAQTLLA